MDFTNLKTFLSVLNNRSFTKASRQLLLTQPAVSIQIKSLEEELGVKLFELSGKKVIPTEAGRILEYYARQIFSILREMNEALDEIKGLKRGTIRIGASTTVGFYILPVIISKFKSKYPGIRIDLMICNTAKIEDEIINDEIDIGIVGGHITKKALQIKDFIEDSIILVVNPLHPWAKRKRVLPRELRGESFLVREKGSATRETTERALTKIGIKLNIGMEMPGPEAIKRGVIAGIGPAFISQFAVKDELKNRSLVHINVSGVNIKRNFLIIHKRKKYFSPALNAFVEELLNFAATHS